MKKRIGFVSNSSSCSFLIYGVCVSGDEITKLAQSLGIEVNEDDGEGDLCELIVEKLGSKGFKYHCPFDNDDYYIGRSWDSIGDEETGVQFKESVEKLLGPECSTHEEAWRDG